MLRWWLAIAVLASCGHAPPASPETGTTHVTPAATPADAAGPPALDDDLPRLAKQSVALYAQLAKVLGPPAATDCATNTHNHDKNAADNADVLAANPASSEHV